MLTLSTIPFELDGLTLNESGWRRDGHVASQSLGDEEKRQSDLGEHGDTNGLVLMSRENDCGEILFKLKHKERSRRLSESDPST